MKKLAYGVIGFWGLLFLMGFGYATYCDIQWFYAMLKAMGIVCGMWLGAFSVMWAVKEISKDDIG